MVRRIVRSEAIEAIAQEAFATSYAPARSHPPVLMMQVARNLALDHVGRATHRRSCLLEAWSNRQPLQADGGCRAVSGPKGMAVSKVIHMKLGKRRQQALRDQTRWAALTAAPHPEELETKPAEREGAPLATNEFWYGPTTIKPTKQGGIPA